MMAGIVLMALVRWKRGPDGSFTVSILFCGFGSQIHNISHQTFYLSVYAVKKVYVLIEQQ